MDEWFAKNISRFNDLQDVKAREEVLTELRIKIGSLNSDEAAEVTRNLDLSRLFSQLTSNDKVVVEQICDTLNVISESSRPGEILWRYTPEIYRLLSHNLPAVKVFALKEILKAAKNPTASAQLMTKTDLLNLTVETIADENLGVAKNAMDILKKIGESTEGKRILYSGTLMRSIAKLLAKDDSVKFRVYEIVVDIAKNNKESLDASVKSGFLQSLIDMIENEDILLQLNALEVLTGLAVTQDGLSYLERQGVLERLSQKIAKAHEEPLSSLLIPGLMKFFGPVAKLCPNEIFSRYPPVITALFEVIENDDQIILAIALDTLGYVSSSVEGKYALQNLGSAMPIALKKISDVIQHMPSDLRVRGLNSLALILDVPKSEQDNKILTLTKSWFDCMCEEPLKMIYSLCKQPFADIRQASLEVLIVIASQAWGQEYIASYPGLIEFLLDRNIETFKECKEVKFQVVKELLESESNIFDESTMEKLKKFVTEGPFYMANATDIAFEGA